jgi:rubrerythrin
VHAYTLALTLISDAARHQVLSGFREDHERHVRELSALVRAHGGIPIHLPHIPTGPFKLAMQATGAVAGDTGVLLAFKTNEGQVRDKYRRALDETWPPDAQPVIARAAHDEDLHYEWVTQELERLGHGRGTITGAAQSAAEAVSRRAVDVVENVKRGAMRVVEELRRGE